MADGLGTTKISTGRRLLDIPLKHLVGFLYVGCFVFLTFALSYAMMKSSDASFLISLRDGLSVGASLIMTLESPRQLLSSAPSWFRALRWAVCFCCWVLIPVLAGARWASMLKVLVAHEV